MEYDNEVYLYLSEDKTELHRIYVGAVDGVTRLGGGLMFLPDQEQLKAEERRVAVDVTVSSWHPSPQTFDSFDAAADALLTLGTMFEDGAGLDRNIARDLAYIQIDRHAPVAVGEILKFMENAGYADVADDARNMLRRAAGRIQQDNAPRPPRGLTP